MVTDFPLAFQIALDEHLRSRERPIPFIACEVLLMIALCYLQQCSLVGLQHGPLRILARRLK